MFLGLIICLKFKNNMRGKADIPINVLLNNKDPKLKPTSGKNLNLTEDFIAKKTVNK